MMDKLGALASKVQQVEVINPVQDVTKTKTFCKWR